MDFIPLACFIRLATGQLLTPKQTWVYCPLLNHPSLKCIPVYNLQPNVVSCAVNTPNPTMHSGAFFLIHLIVSSFFEKPSYTSYHCTVNFNNATFGSIAVFRTVRLGIVPWEAFSEIMLSKLLLQLEINSRMEECPYVLLPVGVKPVHPPFGVEANSWSLRDRSWHFWKLKRNLRIYWTFEWVKKKSYKVFWSWTGRMV